MQQPPIQDTSPASELLQDAQQLGSTAANRLHSEVDARKGSAVSQVQSVSSAMSQTAEGLGEKSPEWLKSALQQGAQQIQRFAEAIEQKDSRQLMSDAQQFARNSPGTFLATCAAAGFAAARVLKAGSDQQRDEPGGKQSPVGSTQYGQSEASQSQPAAFGGAEPTYSDSAPGAGVRSTSPGDLV